MKTITKTSNNTQPVLSLYNVSFVSSFNSLEDFFLWNPYNPQFMNEKLEHIKFK